MGAVSLSNIVEQSLNSDGLEKLMEVESGTIQEQAIAVIKLVMGDVKGAAETELRVIRDYKYGEFFRKYLRYLFGLTQTTVEERHRFAEEVKLKAEDSSGNVILGMVDRLDNINKEKILAQLTIAKIHEAIGIEDFFRLHTMLERIPYVDLKELPQYIEPFYDENGDTELLFATGALELNTLDGKGGPNKYVLSRLGELLLRWGFGIHLELEHGKGTNIELNVADNEDIDAIFDEKMKANRPRLENETLYFPDGTKSGKMEDDEMFLYDVARGK